jgi:hypothetical protein
VVRAIGQVFARPRRPDVAGRAREPSVGTEVRYDRAPRFALGRDATTTLRRLQAGPRLVLRCPAATRDHKDPWGCSTRRKPRTAPSDVTPHRTSNSARTDQGTAHRMAEGHRRTLSSHATAVGGTCVRSTPAWMPSRTFRSPTRTHTPTWWTSSSCAVSRRGLVLRRQGSRGRAPSLRRVVEGTGP